VTRSARQPDAVHARLVAAVRAALGPGPRLADARAAGVEEVILTLHPAAPAAARLDLHLLLVAPMPLFWIERAARRPPAADGLSDWVRRRLDGAAIAEVAPGASGRILRLALGAGPSAEFVGGAIVLDPIPNACRLLILDREGRVEQRYPPTAHAQPQGRGQAGEAYAEPGGQHVEPWVAATAPATGSTAGSGSASATEPNAVATGTVAGAGADALWICRRESGTTAARTPHVFLSPYPCPRGEGPHAPLDAARRAGRAWIEHGRDQACARFVLQRLRREARRLRRLGRELAREVEQARSGPLFRRQAEALLAHAHAVPKKATRVTLPDLTQPGETLAIELDPQLGFSENVRRLFDRAARLERARPVRERRATDVERLTAAVRRWLEQTLVPPTPDALATAFDQAQALTPELERGSAHHWRRLLADWQAAHSARTSPLDRTSYEARSGARGRSRGDDRKEPRAAGKGATEQVSPVKARRFELPGGWEVLVGRSNRENDIVTHRLARPADLWFHARGAAGSHVVLRTGGHSDPPSRRILEQTAAIAAYHSKARTSAMVPVVYTEKRYVRKPRKAPPGVAVCMREKVLMIEPGLPPESKAMRP